MGATGLIFEPLLSAKQAAGMLGGIHVKTLQRMARAKDLPSRRIGRAWFFRASELDQWLRLKSSGQSDRSNGKEIT
ncbi:MAG TPA: helix-turn-helix domain-containing protein [Terriglobales bacterium]|jgi:excisionase family DNA binding protein